MPQPKFDFKSILTKNLLDEKRHVGQPFTFVHCRDTKQVFFTDAVGNYIDFGSILAAVMNGSLPLALPASPVSGPKGEPGRDGRDCICKNGIDGKDGRDGKDAEIHIPTDSEIAKAMLTLRQRFASIQAALLLEMSRLKSLHPNTRIHVKNALDRINREIVQP